VTTLRAVTFDFWHTLLAEHPGTMRAMQLDRWNHVLARAGQRRERADIEAAFAKNWQRFEEHWWSNTGQYTPTDSVMFLTKELGIDLGNELTSSPTLRARLDRLGVLDAFDVWSFSDETGVFKPAPEAFHAALDPLGVEPSDAAHIGDNERTDITGANALGMVSVRYQGLLRVTGLLDGLTFEGLADHVIDDLTTLPQTLQIA
jgi:HAD superfamily hydrolase (TIGR01549 family)